MFCRYSAWNGQIGGKFATTNQYQGLLNTTDKRLVIHVIWKNSHDYDFACLIEKGTIIHI